MYSYILTCSFSLGIAKESPKFKDIEAIGQNCKVKPPSDTAASEDDKKAFAEQVQLILHTCNEKEYMAVLEKLERPTASDGKPLDDYPLYFPNIVTVIGMFAGYRVALMKTGQADQCIVPLVNALHSDFPNTQAIIGVGIAYAKSTDLKFADVMVSDQIENCVQVRWENNKITNRGARCPVDLNLREAFCIPATTSWESNVFPCTDNGDSDSQRKPCLHVGCIVSAPWLVRDLELKKKLFEHTPSAKGGEMEGWALLIVKGIYPDVGVIIIKGVADYGDKDKEDDWQLTAAKAAVHYTHYRLTQAGGKEFRGKHKINTGGCFYNHARYLIQMNPCNPPTLTTGWVVFMWCYF